MAFPELSWLPAEAAWNGTFQAVGNQADEAAWSALVGLANSRIDSLATLRLDRKLRQLFGTTPAAGLATKPVRLAVLASSTADHCLPGLRVGALRRGIWLDTYICDYGQYSRELMDRGSGPARLPAGRRAVRARRSPSAGRLRPGRGRRRGGAKAGPGLRRDRRALAARPGGVRLQGRAADARCRCSRRCSGATSIACPARAPGIVGRLNERMRELAEAEGADLLALDARVGRGRACTRGTIRRFGIAPSRRCTRPRPMCMGTCSAGCSPRSRGALYKCLVLDLDNTLWGGVIGDDGLEGIVLGQGSALGEAYVAFQHYARDLSRRGVILAVCSKNDEANALEPFDKHPDMVLQRADIACFVANWTDKAANIREIARRLNIGLDSLVFADDNPAERAIVRRELPMVAVPELPEDPALYRVLHRRCRLFRGPAGSPRRIGNAPASTRPICQRESADGLGDRPRRLSAQPRHGGASGAGSTGSGCSASCSSSTRRTSST